MSEFQKLFQGRTIKNVTQNNRELLFTFADGGIVKMYHAQECCESVYCETDISEIENICDAEIVIAEERTNEGETDYGTITWSFYTLRTAFDTVVIRWVGESNGYYSEKVDFEIVKPSQQPVSCAYPIGWGVADVIKLDTVGGVPAVASNVIEMVIEDYPMPSIVIMDGVVIEGYGIVNALRSFVEGDLTLTGLVIRKDLEGKTFSDLSDNDKKNLLGFVLYGIEFGNNKTTEKLYKVIFNLDK